MGNNQKTQSNNVQIFLQVSKPTYQVGQAIEGKIHLNIQKQPIVYQLLNLSFICTQTYLQWSQRNKNGKFKSSEKKTFEITKVIHDFQQIPLALGQHSFPFHINLPSLPSNFLIHCQKQSSISLRYKLIATLTSLSFSIPIEKYQMINVVNPYKGEIKALMKGIREVGTACLCWGTGLMEIKIYVNRNFARTGEIIEINGTLDNTSGFVDFQALTCQLVEQRLLTNQSKIYYNQNQRGVLHVVKNLKVKKGVSSNFNFSYKIPQHLQLQRIYLQIKIQLHIEKILFPIEIILSAHSNLIPKPQIINKHHLSSILLLMDSQNSLNIKYQYQRQFPLEEERIQLGKYFTDNSHYNYFQTTNGQYKKGQTTKNRNIQGDRNKAAQHVHMDSAHNINQPTNSNINTNTI